MRETYLVISDTHCGLQSGLVAPGTIIKYYDYTEGTNEVKDVIEKKVELSDWAEWIWYEVWMPGIEAAKEFAGSDSMGVLHAGDAVNGSKFPSHTITTDIENQCQIFAQAMTPLLTIPGLHRYSIAYGTDAHDFAENAASRRVGEKIAAFGLIVEANAHLVGNTEHSDFVIDLAHKGARPQGNTERRGSRIRALMIHRAKQGVEFGETVPGIYIRGHNHEHYFDRFSIPWAGKEFQSAAMSCYPLCGPNGYAVAATNSLDRVAIGMYLFEVIDGRLGEVTPFAKYRTARTFTTF